MSSRIKPDTLRLAQGIAANRFDPTGRRAAIGMTANQAIAICAALSDLWEVASTGEALANDVLAIVPDIECAQRQLRMQSHAHNIKDEMKALAGDNPEEELNHE